MALRTYLPKLQFLARLLCGYIARWERQLRANMTNEQEALLDAVMTACQALDAAIDIEQGG